MSKHRWLTEKEVDDIYDEFEQMRDRDLVTLDILHGAASQLSDINRLIDDWQEMRKLATSLARDRWVPDYYPYGDGSYIYEPRCRYCGAAKVDQMHKDNPQIVHNKGCPYQKYLDMLEATSDD